MHSQQLQQANQVQQQQFSPFQSQTQIQQQFQSPQQQLHTNPLQTQLQQLQNLQFLQQQQQQQQQTSPQMQSNQQTQSFQLQQSSPQLQPKQSPQMMSQQFPSLLQSSLLHQQFQANQQQFLNSNSGSERSSKESVATGLSSSDNSLISSQQQQLSLPYSPSHLQKQNLSTAFFPASPNDVQNLGARRLPLVPEDMALHSGETSPYSTLGLGPSTPLGLGPTRSGPSGALALGPNSPGPITRAASERMPRQDTLAQLQRMAWARHTTK